MSMNSITLANLRQEIVDWCDIPANTASTHVTTSMLTRWINQAIQRLTGILVSLHGEDYYTAVTTLSTSAGVATVALPTRCMRIKSVLWVESSDRIVPLDRISYDEFRDGGSSPTDPDSWDGPPKYMLVGQSISFVPVPNAVYSLRLVYVQSLADLSADGDTWEYGLGWDEWVIADVCSKVARRKDRDVAPFQLARADAERLVRESATGRDEGGVYMVRRIHGQSSLSEYDRATFE